MATTDPLPTPGETVRATVAGKTTFVTIERYGHGIVYTSDWRSWWCGQEGHADGTPTTGAPDLLHLRGYGPLVLVPALEQVAA